MSTNIRFISAGAGSGKTFRLTQELEKALIDGRATPAGVVGTTFTNKAANELRERVRQRLIESGRIRLANAMGQALLGTVNSVCGRLLERFAFDVGLPPELEVLTEEDGRLLFNQAVEAAITTADMRGMNSLQARFDDKEDWRGKVKRIADVARANNTDGTALAGFGQACANELLDFFPKPIEKDLWQELEQAVAMAIEGINSIDDETKKTTTYLDYLTRLRPLIAQKRLTWRQWVKLGKQCPAKKCSVVAAPVAAAASMYDAHPELHDGIRSFTETLFRLAAGSLRHYQEMKTKRGLIDFVDQELLMLQGHGQRHGSRRARRGARPAHGGRVPGHQPDPAGTVPEAGRLRQRGRVRRGRQAGHLRLQGQRSGTDAGCVARGRPVGRTNRCARKIVAFPAGTYQLHQRPFCAGFLEDHPQNTGGAGAGARGKSRYARRSRNGC